MNNLDLQYIQRESKLSDLEMSKILGVSREHYNRVKNGKLKLSGKLVMIAIQRFPRFFLDADITKVVTDSTQVLKVR